MKSCLWMGANGSSSAQTWWQHLAATAELDLTQPKRFLLLSIAFFALRLPLARYGYGTDPDSWRVALTGHYLLKYGQYFPSRLPGYPLQEFLVAPLVPLGPIATNLETALVSLLAVYLFGRIVLHLKLPQPALLTVGFAFTPLLVINSVSTMDYMWTIACILAAYYAVLRGWLIWSGIFAGAAVGFRLPAAVIGLPIAYLLLRESSWRSLLCFSLVAGGVAIAARAPTFVVYGPRVLNFYDASVGYQSVARLLAKEALGASGAVAVLLGFAISYKRLKALPHDVVQDAQVGAWLIMIVAVMVVFLRLPHKIGYALPLFPFGFFLMARYFGRITMAAVITTIVLAGFVDITIHQAPLRLQSIRQLGVGQGLLLSNIDTMKNQTAFVDAVLKAHLPDHSVVMVGFNYAQLADRTWPRFDVGILQKDYSAISMLTDRGEAVDTQHDIRYVWLLNYDDFQALRSQGYNFFLVPDAAISTAALYSYRPTLFGASFFDLTGASQSLGKQPTQR